MGEAVVVDMETGEVIDTVQTEPTMTPDQIIDTLNEINALLGINDDEETDSDEE